MKQHINHESKGFKMQLKVQIENNESDSKQNRIEGEEIRFEISLPWFRSDKIWSSRVFGEALVLVSAAKTLGRRRVKNIEYHFI